MEDSGLKALRPQVTNLTDLGDLVIKNYKPWLMPWNILRMDLRRVG